MSELERKINTDLKINDFQYFNFMHDGYKDIAVIRHLFEAVTRVKNMSKVFSKEFSETEALDKLIDTALAYRIFLNENQEQR